jgi:hypothetical protein
MNFTQEQIKMLAQHDRNMDSGVTPFVRCEKGLRWSFTLPTMEECGVERGQTVSPVVLTALMQASIAQLEALIAIDQIAQKPSTPTR